MMDIAIIVLAICIVVFLIYAWFRTCTFPPNARLLFDAWAAVIKKETDDIKVSPGKCRVTSGKDTREYDQTPRR